MAQKEGTINKTISPSEFEQKLKLANIQLIDVRSPEEYADGGISGSVNINYNSAEFDSEISKLDKDKP
ncbi:MAG: rhodanese-like domain-containing protein, partial [bacterium]